MNAVVREALSAIERGDWDAVRPLLHPYLHWTDPQGNRTRGRTRVLARLVEAPPTAPPSEYELRDAQIYRWTEPRSP